MALWGSMGLTWASRDSKGGQPVFGLDPMPIAAILDGFPWLKRGDLMSDVGTFSRLEPSAAQLPVWAYFDEALLAKSARPASQRAPAMLATS